MTLILCSTPIGNLDDAPPRLAAALEAADVGYAEDTRRSRRLLDALGIDLPLRSYFVGNEATRAEEVRAHLEEGRTVALLTDAGVPGIADPGLSAVRAALAVGATVTIVPGPSAVTAALAVSGLPSERFVFEGFLPRKGEARRRRLQDLAAEERTIVLFLAPSRLVSDLEDLAAAVGDREVVVARELTKAFEEVWRGRLAEAVDHWSRRQARGEFTVVIGGTKAEPDMAAAVQEVLALVGAGVPLSEAVRRTSETSGVRRRALYEAALKAAPHVRKN